MQLGPFLVRFRCSGERHFECCLHQPKALYAVPHNADVRNADRQWLKLAAEVVWNLGRPLRSR
jgi:hypothetical protein